MPEILAPAKPSGEARLRDTTAPKSSGIRKLAKQTIDVLLPQSVVSWRYPNRSNAISLTLDDGPLIHAFPDYAAPSATPGFP